MSGPLTKGRDLGSRHRADSNGQDLGSNTGLSQSAVPAIVAQAFYVGSRGIAFGRTAAASAGANPTTFINVEAHSIAFSALYFWIIPAVFLASIIGVSQTENAIPRILQQFQTKIDSAFPSWKSSLPNSHLTADDVEDRPDTALRKRSGGIYTWQPTYPRNNSQAGSISDNTTISMIAKRQRACYPYVKFKKLRPGSPVLPLLILAACGITSILTSYLIPPAGFETRHIAEILVSSAWLLSAALDYIPFGAHHRCHFWFTFSKDTLTTIATMGGIIAAQVGVFNRCSSYNLWGKVPLALPEVDTVAATLSKRIATGYPAIVFTCIGFQLVVFPGFILWQYSHAARVFLHRDDNASNLQPWHKIFDHFARKYGRFYRRGTRPVLARIVPAENHVRGVRRIRRTCRAIGTLFRTRRPRLLFMAGPV